LESGAPSSVLDSAPALILAAAAARTRRIRLTSAVTVLSAADPVRVFQQFATLDLLSQGRAEMVVGRGSSIEAFPLFGFRLEDYDALFAEKRDLRLKIRENEYVHWSGKHRRSNGAGHLSRPVQNPPPIWLESAEHRNPFAQAGALGLPADGRDYWRRTRRFRPLIDLYRETGRDSDIHPIARRSSHALGYVAPTTGRPRMNSFPATPAP
jgi:alkanesulfonate monooxygenase SsuD/methylene tetrahydromethanopterin reductase-like flavin-dependent oxidoreductase (luciferase family)